MSLLIRNVKVLGAVKDMPEPCDVFVTGETISAIGNFPTKSADEVIDGQGAYLAPGFINADSTMDHYLTLFSEPGQESVLQQGITTIVGGQCGASLAPLLYGSLEAIRKWANPDKINVDWHTMREFLTVMGQRKLGVNFMTLAGHSTVRRALIGEEVRDLTRNELKVMGEVLVRALKEGAFGVSAGLEYVHTRGTSYEELRLLSSVTAEAGGVMAIHLRHTGPGIKEAVQEAVKLQKETGVSLFINHFAPHKGSEKEYEDALSLIDALPAAANLHVGISPVPQTMLAIYRLLPEWSQNGNLELMQKNIRDEWLSRRILKDLPAIDPLTLKFSASTQLTLDGKSLAEYMEIAEITDPKEALLAVMRATRLLATVSLENVDAGILYGALLHPRTIITGGDIAAVLKRAEEGSVPRADAIRKITAVPAHKFGLSRRGEVREGYFADLTVFRGSTVKHVVLKGKVVLKDGAATGVRSGAPLSRVS